MAVGLLSVVLLISQESKADSEVPCYIFSGHAEENCCIDLASLNRITFGNNSMIVSSSSGSNKRMVELLYSHYNNIVIGDAVPTDDWGAVESISVLRDSRIYFDAQTQSLHVHSERDRLFTIAIYDISGKLLQSAPVNSGDAMILRPLAAGSYIAVATGDKTTLNLKFIIN